MKPRRRRESGGRPQSPMSVLASCRGGRRAERWLLPLLAGFLCAGAVPPPAPEAPATASLDEVKVQLKALKRGDNPQLSGAPGNPAVSVPGFHPAPSAATPPAPPSAPESGQRAGLRPANANWLVEAVDRQARARSSPAAGASTARTGETAPLDFSDPTYLLKLYLGQESPRPAAAGSDAPAGEAKPPREAEAAAFNSLLKQWIAPRDFALLGLDAGTAAGYADLLPPAGRAPVGGPPPSPAALAAPNPFLEALKVEPPAPGFSPIAPLPASPPAPAAAVAPAPPPNAHAPAEPGPPPDSSADRKYFPQLKRF